MGKTRVYEIAKELNVETKKIVEYLDKRGITGKMSMSSLEPEQESMLKKAFSAKKETTEKNTSDKTAAKVQTPKKEMPRTEAPKAEASKTEAPKAEASKTEAPKTEAPKADSAAEAPVKKKKKILQVFHPQNASSREARNFHGTSGSAPRNDHQERHQESQGRPVQHTPLVRVPRPHPVVRDEQVMNRPSSEKTSREQVRKTEKTAEENITVKPVTSETSPAAAVKTASVQTSAASAQDKTASAPAVSAAAAQKPAVTENHPASAVSHTAEGQSQRPVSSNEHAAGDRRQGQRTYGDRPQGQRTYGDRPQGQRTYGDRPQGQRTYGDRPQGQRPYGDRPQGQGQRTYGDRPQGQGQRTYGDRPQGQGQRTYGDRPQGQRTYGDRPQGQGQRTYGDRPQGQRTYGDRPQGQRPYGNRPQGQGRPGYGQSRPGYGQGRPGYGQGRPGYGQGRPMDKDADETRKFESKGRRTDHKSSGTTLDTGLKKPSRETGHNKEKDKTKVDLRDNKFTTDRRNGRNQKNLIPKALQKPVYNKPKEEKKEEVKEIRIPEKLTLRDLAEAMKMQPSVIIKKLFLEGKMMTVNQELTFEEAGEIALSYDIMAEQEEKVDVIAELLKEEDEDTSRMISRPPVVCVMGHVDHGKTSLLDAIRHAHVTDREAGGITQNIGAYVVNINGRKITFLDTPGHEAFTAMRMRGANSTDIAVLVVAADDGVMPQTIEAINHAKAANVEIIVAVNKIDKPNANIERVKQELSEYGLISEDWGGSTVFCPVSAKTKEGIDNLLEMILLTSDVMELKADPDRKARGLVLEAKLDKGKGPVANVLIQKGTLHVGDYIACGSCSGKVRALMDENSRRVKAAGPSTPVEILGLDNVPDAGEVMVSTDTDKDAKNFAATFVTEEKSRLLEDTKARMSLDDLFSQIKEGTLKELNLVVKADVQGSVEALKQSLVKLSNEEVVVKIIHGGVGAITESDITLAAASNAIVIGFNVRPDATAKTIAEQEKVDVRLYRVIYQAIDDIEAAMKGMLAPVYEEKIIGHAEVRQLFKASGVGTIAGSYVLDGSVQRGCKVRITREGDQIFEGNLASLKRFKDDVKEAKAGYECGLVFEDFNEVRELDQVEAYIMVEVPR